MLISTAFPSNYLKAADLQGKQVTVTIDRVTYEEIGRDREQRPVLYFKGKDKGVVLNKTNANNISMAYGDDTEDWDGAEVVLYEAMVDFQGQSTAAIRIKVPPRRRVERSPAAPFQDKAATPANGERQRTDERRETRAPAMAEAPIDDDIPF